MDMQNFLVNLLKDYAVVTKNNGADALEFMLTATVVPQLIITDYMMPELNGEQLVKRLRAEGFNLPVLVLTAYEDDMAKSNLFRLGILDYIQKPFEIQPFFAAIEHLVERNTVASATEKEQNIALKEVEEHLRNIDEVGKVYDFVYQNCGQHGFVLEDVLDEMSMSRSSFYRRLKVVSGFTPAGFIKEVRLNKAHDIIRDQRNCSIKYVLAEIGWSNSTRFYEAYQKRYAVDLKTQLSEAYSF